MRRIWRYLRQNVILPWWESPYGIAVRYTIDRLYEWVAWITGVRPWQAQHRVFLDWIYLFKWFVNHYLYILFGWYLAIVLWPDFTTIVLQKAGWIEYFIPHLHRVEKTIPGWYFASVVIYSVLNEAHKYFNHDTVQRWRRGNWFVWIWGGLCILCWTLDALQTIPGVYPVTIATEQIAAYTLAARTATLLWRRLCPDNGC